MVQEMREDGEEICEGVRGDEAEMIPLTPRGLDFL